MFSAKCLGFDYFTERIKCSLLKQSLQCFIAEIRCAIKTYVILQKTYLQEAGWKAHQPGVAVSANALIKEPAKRNQQAQKLSHFSQPNKQNISPYAAPV